VRRDDSERETEYDQRTKLRCSPRFIWFHRQPPYSTSDRAKTPSGTPKISPYDKSTYPTGIMTADSGFLSLGLSFQNIDEHAIRTRTLMLPMTARRN
jgi:hypothetical protein